MRLRLSEKPAEWRKFTWSSAAAVTLFTVLAWWRGRVSAAVPLGIAPAALALALGAWRRPGWFRGFYRAGRTVGHWIGRVVGTVLLAVLFCVVLVPLGLAMRMAGQDPLRLKRDPGARSYWLTARPPGDFNRMF